MIVMDMKWSLLVLLLVIHPSYIECEDNVTVDSTKDAPPAPSLPTGGADNGSSNRRRPITDPEHEHSSKAQASEGLYFDTADWSKEAEKWMFKGGDWGLVTLPDDKHPDIADPPVPGPVLLAEGNSMQKVIVSRSLSGLEDVSLHFSYFLTSNPLSPPELKVYQLQGNKNSLVWPTHAEIDNVGYGQWNHGSLDRLPFNGDFQIKFIGQRVIDENDIGLDDIVLRGTHMKKTEGDTVLKSGDDVKFTTILFSQNGNDTEMNNMRVEMTTSMSNEDNIKVTMQNNNSISETEDDVSNNSSMVTESPQVSNDTGTSVADVNNQSYTSAPDNFSSNEAPSNDTDTEPKTTVPSDHPTTLDKVKNTTDPIVDITTMLDDNITIFSNVSTTLSFNNATVGENSTDNSQNVSTTHLSQNITSFSPINATTLQIHNQTEAPILNITIPSLNTSNPLFNITSNASISVTGAGGIGGTGSPPVEEASWGVFKILLTITVLGGCVLLYLYWRQRRIQDDEISVFSRGSHADYHNPTFHDDISSDEGLTGRGIPSNYKSFS